jgi:hypothetical protein
MVHTRIAAAIVTGVTGAALFGTTLLAAPPAQAAPVTAAAPTAVRTAAVHTAAVRAATTASAAGLDRRCRKGRVVCVSKYHRKVYWVVNGKIKLVLDARFGARRTPTREGSFRIRWKDRNHRSSLYHTPMPFAMFFSGGQAVHYSPDFAKRGYRGASHGCVNTRQYSKMRALFNAARVGDRVVVYHHR